MVSGSLPPALRWKNYCTTSPAAFAAHYGWSGSRHVPASAARANDTTSAWRATVLRASLAAANRQDLRVHRAGPANSIFLAVLRRLLDRNFNFGRPQRRGGPHSIVAVPIKAGMPIGARKNGIIQSS